MGIKEKILKIQLCGSSGTGKTTVANQLSKIYDIPFISGSYSGLVPSTKDEPHKDMITKEANLIYQQDYQLLNLRKKQLLDPNISSYVSDRSFIDNATYFIDKLAHRIPECEVEPFIDICRELLKRTTTHIIFIPYTSEYLKSWKIEDNNKRVLNKYFQFKISSIMDNVLHTLIFKDSLFDMVIYRDKLGTPNPYYIDNDTLIRVLYLNSMGREERIDVIKQFIKL